jgi:hypothetical protein
MSTINELLESSNGAVSRGYINTNFDNLNTDKLEASDIAGLFDKSADDLDDITEGATNKHYSASDKSKLAGIEAGADVTDTANVTSAGALMDSEVTNLADVKSFDPDDYAPALGADDNYVTNAEKVVIGNTSGTNSGDQTLPVKATGGELDTGTDDNKFATAKALADSAKLGAPTTILTSDGSPTGNYLNNYLTVSLTARDITVGAPSGTPLFGSKLFVYIGNGSTMAARTATWDAVYTSKSATIPTAFATETGAYLIFAYNSISEEWECILSSLTTAGSGDVEGTAIKSTGETGGSKFLREDGDGTCSWQTVSVGTGDVVGPSSSTDNAIARYDSITGKLLQNSSATVADNGTIACPYLSTPDIYSLAALGIDDDLSITGGNTGKYILDLSDTNPTNNKWLKINNSETGAVLTSQGANANIELVTQGTGVVKANTVEVATISGEQTLTNKNFGDGLGITVANGGNKDALVITQNDVTNNPYPLEIINAGSAEDLVVENSRSGAYGVYVNLYHNSSSPGDDDEIGRINFQANESAATNQLYARILAFASGVTSGAEAGNLYLDVKKNGTLKNLLALEGDSDVNGILIGDPNDGAGVLSSYGNNDLILKTGNATTGNITIVDGADGQISLNPNGTGTVKLGTLTGVLRADTGVVSVDTDVTDIVSAASDTVAGKVELATAAETTTGTATDRAVTPDGLAGSDYGKRVVQIQVSDPAGDAITTGDGKAYFFISSELNGYNLVDADACVTTVSSSGTPDIQIRNVTDSQDMLSTRITIDASEKTSYTAATAPVINTSYDDVATGDQLAIDIDGAGTGAKGLTVILTFQKP